MLVVRSVLAALAAALVLAATASATPIYTLENCFSSDTSVCAAGTQLGAAVSAVPTPDGTFVYGVAGNGGVSVYTRAASHGTLTRVPACYDQSGAGGCTPESGLIAPFDLVFDPTDPTGAYTYVIGNTGTMAILARNAATGAFTAQANCISDFTATGCPQPSATTEVLTGSRSEAFSPDGKNLYVASSGRNSGADDGIARFSVGASHVPVFEGCTTASGAGACAQGNALNGGTDQMAITADGKFLYTTGVSANAVAVIPRNTSTGALDAANIQCYTSNISVGCTGGLADLSQPYAVLIPPDDQTKVYVGTGAGVSVYARNTTTGALTRLQCLGATAAGACGAAPGLGISVVNHLALSQDGTDLAVTEAGPNGGIVFLKRSTATGLLGELGGGAGCVTADGTGGACRTLTALGGISLVHAAPNAAQFYLGAVASGTIAAFRADNPPVCTGATVNTAFQTSVAVPLSCADPDGDPVSLGFVHAPAHGGIGAIDQTARATTYSPASGFSGVDSFMFTAIAHGLSAAPATDTINVAPAPPPPTPRITSAIKTEWLAGSTTKVVRLTVEDIPKGATVKVTCKGTKHARHRGGCTFSSKTYHEPNGKKALALKSKFKGAKLRPDTVITVDITAPGSIGKEVRFTIRKRHLPKSKTYCLPAGSTHAHTRC